MKLLRWKYILPRLIAVALLATATYFGLDPCLRWALITGGEAAVGAKVEVDSLTTSLSDGTLSVEGLTLANPSKEYQNLLETSDSQLILDMNALCHRRLVVTEGSVKGIQIGTIRETSGFLAPSESKASEEPSVLDPLLDAASDHAANWLDELSDQLTVDITSELESPRVAKELEDRWPEEYALLTERVKALKSQGKELEDQFKKLRKNPLRHVQELQQLQADIHHSQQELKTLQQQISNLPKQAEQDRQAVLAARKHDETYLRNKLRLGKLDEEGITQTILGQPVNQGLSATLEWLSWIRKKVPTKKDHEVQRSRGTYVLYSPPKPQILIEQLQIHGEASWNGQSMPLVGSLRDFTTEPYLHSAPTVLDMHSKGPVVIACTATVDRRQSEPIDTIELSCKSLPISGQSLGNSNKLAIEVADSNASLDINLKIIDEQISGTIQLSQNSLNLAAKGTGKRETLAAAITEGLSAVENWQASIQLTGDLKKPKFDIDSDLGHQLAVGIQAAGKNYLEDQSEKYLADIKQDVDARLAKLNQLRTAAQEELLAKLGEGQAVVEQLAALSGQGTSGLAVPKIGKSLSLPKLLK